MDLPDLPQGLADELTGTYIRPEAVAAARARLADGQAVTALDLADALLEPFRDLPAAS
jgi:hypothetical protein